MTKIGIFLITFRVEGIYHDHGIKRWFGDFYVTLSYDALMPLMH